MTCIQKSKMQAKRSCNSKKFNGSSKQHRTRWATKRWHRAILRSAFWHNSGWKTFTARAKEIAEIARHELVPVTYGDAMWHSKCKSFILSGDRVMTMLALALKAKMCIFATNVDGLFENLTDGKLIRNSSKGSVTDSCRRGRRYRWYDAQGDGSKKNIQYGH